MKRRMLGAMPCDKAFETENGEVLCHATGYEVCFDDPSDPANWRNEYQDADGQMYYGR